MARRHQIQPMAGTFASMYLCEESLHIQGVGAAYRARPARTRRGTSDRSVTCPADSFLGVPPAWTCRGTLPAVYCCTIARQSPRFRFLLGRED